MAKLPLEGMRGALVLTRRPGESLIFETSGDPPIEVEVVSVRGDKVVLLTRAAGSTRIIRRELIDREAA